MKNLMRSQNAHKRCMKKHKNMNTERDWILHNYHSACFEQQKKKGRILSDKEKETIFKTTCFYCYN